MVGSKAKKRSFVKTQKRDVTNTYARLKQNNLKRNDAKKRQEVQFFDCASFFACGKIDYLF